MWVFSGVGDGLESGDTQVRRSSTGLKSLEGDCWLSRLKYKKNLYSIRSNTGAVFNCLRLSISHPNSFSKLKGKIVDLDIKLLINENSFQV